jgi:hypothetical protein
MASYSSFTKTRSPVLGICILALTTGGIHCTNPGVALTLSLEEGQQLESFCQETYSSLGALPVEGTKSTV